MAFAGSTYEPEGRGRLAYDGFMTVHTADEGRCHIDPKLQPVYTPGPAAHYDLQAKRHVKGMGFGSSTSSRFEFNDTRSRRRRDESRPSTTGGSAASGRGGSYRGRTGATWGSGSLGLDRPSTSDATVLTKRGSFGASRPSTSDGAPKKYWTFGDGKSGRPRPGDHGILFGFSSARSARARSRSDSTFGDGSTVLTPPPPTPAPSLFSSSQRYSPVQWRSVEKSSIALKGRGADSPGPKYFPPVQDLHHLVDVNFTDSARFQGRDYYIPASHSPGPPETVPPDDLTRDHRHDRKLTDGGRHENGSIFGFVKHHLSPGPVYAPWDSFPKNRTSMKSHHACAQRPRVIGVPVKKAPGVDWIH
jgi:hypothetical protein